MNPALDQWLASCARTKGMLGCGVQLADRTSVSHSFNEALPQTHLAETLRCLEELSPVFLSQGLFPRWHTWNFETGQLRAVVRPDGALLVLVLQPNSPAAENLAGLTGEFLALKFAD
jgi:hypothetical protein